MTEEENPTFDSNRVAELMTEYEQASSQQERRRIEENVLAETVRQVGDEDPAMFASYTREELKRIDDAVETDDETTRMLLRRAYVRGL